MQAAGPVGEEAGFVVGGVVDHPQAVAQHRDHRRQQAGEASTIARRGLRQRAPREVDAQALGAREQRIGRGIAAILAAPHDGGEHAAPHVEQEESDGAIGIDVGQQLADLDRRLDHEHVAIGIVGLRVDDARRLQRDLDDALLEALEQPRVFAGVLGRAADHRVDHAFELGAIRVAADVFAVFARAPFGRGRGEPVEQASGGMGARFEERVVGQRHAQHRQLQTRERVADAGRQFLVGEQLIEQRRDGVDPRQVGGARERDDPVAATADHVGDDQRRTLGTSRVLVLRLAHRLRRDRIGQVEREVDLGLAGREIRREAMGLREFGHRLQQGTASVFGKVIDRGFDLRAPQAFAVGVGHQRRERIEQAGTTRRPRCARRPCRLPDARRSAVTTLGMRLVGLGVKAGTADRRRTRRIDPRHRMRHTSTCWERNS